ncbi:SRPBCC domain-containing protein [Flavitalea sp. BT771]|uniref:SRPBCC family protein n=1 Tax=Flavitalea sp. BT771 TaxID=3063329 RepID=UPI0026E3500C|nr:SRPBCC domain-containing protein [Flavitalea sp. BT771]MDO6434083.1 SRPBCC domain-containing protein [Flavitalea sp. BT771]MDV6222983.1 SRPBCC domain-containing protein [Flavitalea sp. BT771]
MEKEFKITIDAPREKVWNALWKNESYQQWTAPFAAGSRAETDWKKGSKVLFLDGKNSGMVSTIVDNKPNEFMSIRHLGIINNGVEDLDSAESRQWAGALENYTLRTVNGKTELIVDMEGNIPEAFVDYFVQTWPKALEKLKEIAERN